MQQNSFPREVMCALLSPSFGAHLDCPPRPTEQWLYGWVDRYLNLSAMTITLPHIHTCYTLPSSNTRPHGLSILAFVCASLKLHYIGWVISVVVEVCVFFYIHGCHGKFYNRSNACLQFIILARLSISAGVPFVPEIPVFVFLFFSTCLLNPFSTVWDLF